MGSHSRSIRERQLSIAAFTDGVGQELSAFSHQLFATPPPTARDSCLAADRNLVAHAVQRHSSTRTPPGAPSFHRPEPLRLLQPEWRVRNHLPSRINSSLLTLPGVTLC